MSHYSRHIRQWRPTEGKSPMGWMNVKIDKPKKMGFYTIEEIKEHKDDNWMLLGDKVYDLTKYLEYHPGGTKILQKFCGRDGTKAFARQHRWVNYTHLLEKCLIGFFNNPQDSDSGSETEKKIKK
ncbi:cytochrome b5 reductase 4 family member [Anaeramoeba flamelloides]|uniref:Cytochrome b5 reductase 4 family member n=1 Tax=Anaeramoeba flamelloides TaxID=1746091 RepID=A0ABQ8Z2K9_9EUKA|nr:cytochrome b5 reductase 4 family member [Anaeramoeba flamelloides]